MPERVGWRRRDALAGRDGRRQMENEQNYTTTSWTQCPSVESDGDQWTANQAASHQVDRSERCGRSGRLDWMHAVS